MWLVWRENCADIFLSQISMLTDWDVLLLQECFRKLDGVDVGVHELFTPSELLGGLRCPAVIVNRKWKGQSKIVGGAARWTAVELDGQLTFISAHLPHKGKKLGEIEAVLMEIQEFVSGRPKQHVILGGDFNANLFGMTDYFHVGESIPRPRTLIDTNDSLRARALHTMVTELDLTVTNTWMNADAERELFTRSSWSNPEDSLTQMDFIMTSRKLEMKHVQVLDSDWFKDRSQSGVCSSFVDTENEVHGEDCCKLAWLDARRLLARCGCSNFDILAELEQVGTFACGNCESSQKDGIQGDVRDRNGAQNTTVEKEDDRSIPRTIRTELALSRNLEKEKSTEKRETPGQDQGECRVGESPQENAEQAFQLEINCEGRKSQVYSHKILPRPILNLRRTGEVDPIRETTLGGAVEKHENRLCWWNVDLAKETGKCPGEIEKTGKARRIKSQQMC